MKINKSPSGRVARLASQLVAGYIIDEKQF